MNGFDDREKAFEAKFERDEEASFRIASRAARIFGEWIGGQLGLKDEALKAYAKEMVDAIVAQKDHEGLITKAEESLKAKNLPVSRHRLEREMESFYQSARQQSVSDKP